MNTSSLTCLFMPGLPGEKKKYRIFDDLHKAECKIDWLCYRGTYCRKDEAKFNLENCCEDVINKLNEQKGNYFIIAYSFSTFIIKKINPKYFKGCVGIILVSPINSLALSDIKVDFHEQLSCMEKDGIVNNDRNAWDITCDDPTSTIEMKKWLEKQNEANIPVMLISSLNDNTSMSKTSVQECQKPFLHNGSVIKFFEVGSQSNHKIDSMYNTVLRPLVWAFLCINILQSIDEKSSYFLWGSTLDSGLWTDESDLDLLRIGEIDNDLYKTIHETEHYLEKISNLDIGISHNEINDFKKDGGYIRRNRGDLFVYELSRDSICLYGKIDFTPPRINAVRKDAANIIKISVADIEKMLGKYYSSPNKIAKAVTKSFIQACRVHMYLIGENIATLDLENRRIKPWLRKDLSVAFKIKQKGYKNVSFDELLGFYRCLDRLMKEQGLA